MSIKKPSLFFISLSILTSVFVFNTQTVNASSIPVVTVRDAGYSAKYVSQTINDPVKIEAGSTINVDVKFKNIGTKTWDNSGRNFVSAFTMEPRYRNSDFAGANWTNKSETSKMSPALVKPGEEGVLSIQIKAPEKAGSYTEKFWLASQNYSWIKGGYFYLIINVVPKTSVSVPNTTVTPNNDVTTPKEEVSSAIPLYKAKKFISNITEVKAPGAKQVKVILALQNLGTATWQNYSLVANTPVFLSSNGVGNLTFADSNWQNNTTILEKSLAVPQWGFTRDEFTFVTPAKMGKYTLTLKLKANNTDIENFEVNIPVEVTSDVANYIPPQYDNNNNTVVVEVPRLDKEPLIRVGLWQNPESQVLFRSNDDDYVIMAGSVDKGILKKGSTATMYYENGIYHYASSEIDFTSNDYLHLVPVSNWHAVYELLNYERNVSWKGPVNFNKYRGAMELRKVNSGSDVYVIEEVYMEDYVAGIAETSNAGPTEYIKALLTAARTYAYYVKEYTTKHDTRNFDVVAHTGDQLYLGYASELLMPNVVAAQKATRGYMVTYNNDYIITPYYSTSDGRTRSWSEVWGGSTRPWLVSVIAIYDKRDGKSLAGHGVGMSARDAAYMAEDGGKNWQEILKYYYTGVDTSLIYR